MRLVFLLLVVLLTTVVSREISKLKLSERETPIKIDSKRDDGNLGESPCRDGPYNIKECKCKDGTPAPYVCNNVTCGDKCTQHKVHHGNHDDRNDPVRCTCDDGTMFAFPLNGHYEGHNSGNYTANMNGLDVESDDHDHDHD